MRRAAHVLGVVTLGLVLQLSPSYSQSGRFEEATTVVAIEVPVQVMKDGQPVRGLTAEDFEIFDGRKKQEIVGFEVIDLALFEPGREESRVADLSVSARRHFLLLFDLSFSQPDSVTRARSAALELVREEIHPADLVAVGTYAAARGFQLVLGFTSDRGQVEVAIDTLGLAQPLHEIEDPLGLMIADLGGRPGGAGAGTVGSGGGRGGAEAAAMAYDLYTLSTRMTRDQKQNQILALVSSLEEAAKLLRSVPGRAHVILLSEGFETSVMLGAEGTTQDEQRRMHEMGDAVAYGESWRVDSDERFGSGIALSGMERMLEEFRRSDVTIHTVDVGGLAAGGDVQRGSSVAPDRQNSLFVMADGTGGQLYRNFNDLGSAMSAMLDSTSVTYVLSFQRDDLELDGAYHRLKVRLQDDSKATRLVHRPGYYAPRPLGEQSGLERQLLTAGLVMGGYEGGDIDTSVLVTPLVSPDGRAQVPVLIEVDGADLVAGETSGYALAEIYAYAIGRSGSIGDFIARTLALDLSEVGADLQRSGLKFWGRMELDPGSYVIRVLVRNGETGRSTVRAVPVDIPAAGAGPQLLPPLVEEPMDKWVMRLDDDATAMDYPFISSGEPFVPAARPVLQAGQINRMWLMGIDLPESGTVASIQLLDAGGGLAGQAVTSLSGGGSQGYPGYQCRQAAVMLPRVEPGEYRLVVTLGDPSLPDALTSALSVLIES